MGREVISSQTAHACLHLSLCGFIDDNKRGKCAPGKIEYMCWRCLHLYFVGTLEECGTCHQGILPSTLLLLIC